MIIEEINKMILAELMDVLKMWKVSTQGFENIFLARLVDTIQKKLPIIDASAIIYESSDNNVQKSQYTKC